MLVGRRRRDQAQGRSLAQALSRGPVAQDQSGDRGVPLRPIEPLRDGGKGPLSDLHAAVSVGFDVEHPIGVGTACGDKDGSVRLLEVPDRGPDASSGDSPARLEDRDLAPGREFLTDLVGPWAVALVRQRAPRCQDLPSVWTDGA